MVAGSVEVKLSVCALGRDWGTLKSWGLKNLTEEEIPASFCQATCPAGRRWLRITTVQRHPWKPR